MDEEGFTRFLKKSRKAPSVIKRCLVYVTVFEQFLQGYRKNKRLEEANEEDLSSFAEWVRVNSNVPIKTYLWALRYYFEYTGNKRMRKLVSELRQQQIRRKTCDLKNFRGVHPEHVKKLAAIKIRNADQMIAAGKTRIARQKLSEKTNIPDDAILELVKLSDLSRIFGVKATRARLYHDAGIDTVEKMAKQDPEELRAYLMEFVERTHFDGIAPLPKEAKFTVEEARKLPKIVEY